MQIRCFPDVIQILSHHPQFFLHFDQFRRRGRPIRRQLIQFGVQKAAEPRPELRSTVP
jgi:hypothetical protein